MAATLLTSRQLAWNTESRMQSTFEKVAQPDYSLAGTVLLTTVVLSACAIRYGVYLMIPDNFNYIAYWEQLFEGSFRTTSLQTPKPLLVIIFGALWRLTGSLVFLIVLFIGIGTLAAYGSAGIVIRMCGAACGWSVLALLLPNAAFLRAVLAGYSEVISAAGAVWLIHHHLEVDRIRLPDRCTAVGLFALNLVRPDNWLLSAGVAIAAGTAIAVSPSRPCGLGSTLGQARHAVVDASFPLLAPFIWIGFDYLAFGDPLYSFKTTAHFAEVATATSAQIHWYAYFPELATSIRNQVSLFALGCAAIGVAVVSRRRPFLLILLGLPFITNVAFYFLTYIAGMATYDRFFFVPVLMILVVSCIGLASATNWLQSFQMRLPRMPIASSLRVVGKRVLVVAVLMLLLAMEHRNLPFKVSVFDTYARWRISALSAAEAVRRDSDYGQATPVIVRVEDLALVGWALRSDGRTLTDTLTYKREGARLSSEVRIAFFIINQSHQGKLFPELASGRLPGLHTNIIYDDWTTVVYKVARIPLNW